MKWLRLSGIICQGTFLGGEIEPGTFHGGEIEPGTFHHYGNEVTSDLKDKDKDDTGNGEEDERPVHAVTLAAYEIGTYEVTNADYAAALAFFEEGRGFHGFARPFDYAQTKGSFRSQ